MDWEKVVQMISILGGICSPIIVILFYRVKMRKITAEARLLEKQGDTESTKPLETIIKRLEGENERLTDRVSLLEKAVKQLQESSIYKDHVIDNYNEAGKECHSCAFNTTVIPCPAIVKYKQLTK